MSVLSEDLRQRILSYLPRYPRKQAATLPALHLVQDEKRCVTVEAVREIADLAPSAALRSCLSRSCSDACSFAVPTRPLPEDSPAAVPDDPRKPKKI